MRRFGLNLAVATLVIAFASAPSTAQQAPAALVTQPAPEGPKPGSILKPELIGYWTGRWSSSAAIPTPSK
jgi:hypothetical protein